MYLVIIVEDENIIRKGLMYSIPWRDLECSVVGEASNGVDGLELIGEKSPDIVIMDINMPIMGGLEMLEKSYEKYNYAAIILSGYSDFEYAQKAICYGVKGYLLKPLQVDELFEAIQLAKQECSLRQMWISKKKEKENLRDISLMKEFNNKPINNDLVNKILDYVNQNYQRKIVMQDFVEYLNYSETFLNKVFKDVIGTTLIEYLNRYRIQKALEYMRQGKLSIQEISYQCGIGDSKYFHVVFKKYIGISPKEYKNSINN